MAIVDGPDAGKTTTADTSGRYSFVGLRQAGFTLRASANGYTPGRLHLSVEVVAIGDRPSGRTLSVLVPSDWPGGLDTLGSSGTYITTFVFVTTPCP